MSQTVVLHLCSWYPSRVDPFIGDFIQRQIACIDGGYRHVVVHTKMDPTRSKIGQDVAISELDGVEERIVYFNPILKIFEKIYHWVHAYNAFIKVKHEYGLPIIVHVHATLYLSIVAKYICCRYDVPYVITEHSTLFLNKAKSIKDLLIHKIAKIGVSTAMRMIPVSKHLGQAIKSNIFQPSLYTVIPNVVPNYFEQKKIWGPAEKFRIVHVSTLKDNHKNISGILKAAQMLRRQRPDFILTLIGMHQKYKTADLVYNLLGDVDWVKLKGPMNHREIAKEMGSHDIFVLFSRFENLPCVLLEALTIGLPCIATDVGGINEIIDDSNGVLIPSENITELLVAMNHVMNNYQKFTIDEIQKEAISKYSEGAVREKILSVYSQVLEQTNE